MLVCVLVRKPTMRSYSILTLAVLLMCAAGSEAAVRAGKDAAKALLAWDDLSDWAVSTVFIFIAYTLVYMVSAGLFELTNPNGFRSQKIPAAARKQRLEQIHKEIKLSVLAMVVNVGWALIWMRWVEPHLWTHGYFSPDGGKAQYSFGWFVFGVLAYAVWTDAWFYMTHRLLHESKWLWDNVHTVHHAFKHPTAFCQDAVHPLEAAIQGPMGHTFSQLLFPVHPVPLAVCGFLTSLYAIAAHDGRMLDLNNHTAHHTQGLGRKKNFNYGLYWGLWDYVFGTRYSDFQKANVKAQ
eukprot:m.397882 g.397882  ORF g.397882 m.397882 type:complete len:294 (+) comp20107_c6_seq5:2488-3369(+)